MKNFNGKLALITGGSSGIGLALACQLFASGMSVVILARGQQRLDEAIEKIEKSRQDPSQRLVTITANVTDADAIAKTLHDLVATVGLPDLVINCAGVAKSSYAEMTPLEDFRWIMDIDYHGTVNVDQTLLPDFIARGSGHIVNISSLAGAVGVFGYTAYGGAKFAVRGYTDALRSEMKPRGIQVSCVYPPDTDTPQLAWENQFKPDETRLIAGSDKPLSADQVAKSIIRGIQKNKYTIVPGLEAKVLFLAAMHLGGLVYPVLDLLVKNAAKKKAANQDATSTKHSQ